MVGVPNIRTKPSHLDRIVCALAESKLCRHFTITLIGYGK
jgi:hypothetical protein